MYEAAAKALRAASVFGKLTNIAALKAEYEKLQQQKEVLYADYGKIKNRSRNTASSSWT